ncbi:twitching motility protein PilT [Candidatus Fermentibacteria bacterium]|nr:twitching motility protein PilT [Candidatus Fermentibacteria bacterium]
MTDQIAEPGGEARIRFYAELNDFLPSRRANRELSVAVKGRPTVKHLIESMGVPHTEVDLVLLNGRSVGFDRIVSPGDRMSVYPVFESMDVSPVVRLRPAPLRKTRFLLDVHLGKLAFILRLLGFDAAFPGDLPDDELARMSVQQNRILLTRDIALLKRRIVTHGCYIRSDHPVEQAREVLDRLDLRGSVEPFKRCVQCGGELEPVKKEAIIDRLEPLTKRYYDRFKMCRDCGKIYWRGSHFGALKKLLSRLGISTELEPE